MDQVATLDVAAGSVTHPLDPLTVAEIGQACRLVSEVRSLGPSARFAIVELHEPPKGVVLAFRPGDAIPREAFLVILDISTGDAFEAVADLREARVASWRQIDTGPEHGQPPVIVEEFFRAADIVKADPGWRAAVKRRGLTDEDIERVQVDPISAGYFDFEVHQNRRIVRAVSYYREHFTDNGYAHPIEGLIAITDLIAGTVVELHDDGRNVPIPKRKYNYDQASLGPFRTDLKPLSINQPDGASFEVDGWRVSWQRWSFRVGFTPREGLVLHQIGFEDGGRVRPIVYRASVTEMAVPYADPTPQHYGKCAFDAGEYGLGKLANQLELGCDCLGLIHYFDVPAVDDLGKPVLMKNAICLHEEDYGVLWKHYDFRTGAYQTRRSRRLVISFFATVGNYDYGFYWYLYQDGTIQLEAKLTGIVQTAAVMPGESYRWGGMVDENLGGPSHQHFFNARLHMMVDGERNCVTEHEYLPVPMGPDNPVGNVFRTASRKLTHELEAARDADGATGRFWKVVNPASTNAMGVPAGYKLIVTPAPMLLAAEGSSVRKRAGFATKAVWVTAYDPEERFASGDYPNQHAGDCGLPKYARQDRNIEDADIVLWHSFGHTHVCKPEDFPIMPVDYTGFTLKPNNFFTANPTMDLPAGPDPHSGLAPAGSGCCCGPEGAG